MAFPESRFRRLRDHAVLREMVAETTLAPRQLVQPLFVKEGLTGRQPIESMPGQAQLGLEELAARRRGQRRRACRRCSSSAFRGRRSRGLVGHAGRWHLPQAVRA